MKKNIFLTSALAMGFVLPAMAETFPSNGYMQENKTYDNAATSTNMDGVYEGTVNAVAEYENILYQIGAGQYLPAGAESPINCNVPGSFCPGVQNGVNYDANNNQGLTSCSSATNGAYTSSDGTGTSADSCYRECSGNVTIAHATGVTGKDYYGNGTDTCGPTACENGYHITYNVKPGGVELQSIIGDDYGWGIAYKNSSGNGEDYDNLLTENNTWAGEYGETIVYGRALCSSRSGIGPWGEGYTLYNENIVYELNDDGGDYCYCNVTGYKTTNGDLQTVSSPWLLKTKYNGGCADWCADTCAGSGSYNTQIYYTTLFSLIDSVPTSCAVNEIRINWSNTDAADVSANNAGTATYGGDIRTPVKAKTQKGKTFKGWRFSKPSGVIDPSYNLPPFSGGADQ